MAIAYITFSREGYSLAERLKEELGGSIYFHESIGAKEGISFPKVGEVIPEIWRAYSRIVFLGASGIAVRSIAPLLVHKTVDPAVVVADIGGRFVFSLLSGHEGGANLLAYAVANVLGALPVITTASEARKDIVVGLGCRKGVSLEDLKEALLRALAKVEVDVTRVRHIATLEVKKGEPGLLALSRELKIPLLFLKKERILTSPYVLPGSSFVLNKVGVPAVAEPACLLVSHQPKLILRRMVWKNTTIALAQEQFLSWE